MIESDKFPPICRVYNSEESNNCSIFTKAFNHIYNYASNVFSETQNEPAETEKARAYKEFPRTSSLSCIWFPLPVDNVYLAVNHWMSTPEANSTLARSPSSIFELDSAALSLIPNGKPSLWPLFASTLGSENPLFPLLTSKQIYTLRLLDKSAQTAVDAYLQKPQSRLQHLKEIGRATKKSYKRSDRYIEALTSFLTSEDLHQIIKNPVSQFKDQFLNHLIRQNLSTQNLSAPLREKILILFFEYGSNEQLGAFISSHYKIYTEKEAAIFVDHFNDKRQKKLLSFIMEDDYETALKSLFFIFACIESREMCHLLSPFIEDLYKKRPELAKWNGLKNDVYYYTTLQFRLQESINFVQTKLKKLLLLAQLFDKKDYFLEKNGVHEAIAIELDALNRGYQANTNMVSNLSTIINLIFEIELNSEEQKNLLQLLAHACRADSLEREFYKAVNLSYVALKNSPAESSVIHLSLDFLVEFPSPRLFNKYFIRELLENQHFAYFFQACLSLPEPILSLQLGYFAAYAGEIEETELQDQFLSIWKQNGLDPSIYQTVNWYKYRAAIEKFLNFILEFKKNSNAQSLEEDIQRLKGKELFLQCIAGGISMPDDAVFKLPFEEELLKSIYKRCHLRYKGYNQPIDLIDLLQAIPKVIQNQGI